MESILQIDEGMEQPPLLRLDSTSRSDKFKIVVPFRFGNLTGNINGLPPGPAVVTTPHHVQIIHVLFFVEIHVVVKKKNIPRFFIYDHRMFGRRLPFRKFNYCFTAGSVIPVVRTSSNHDVDIPSSPEIGASGYPLINRCVHIAVWCGDQRRDAVAFHVGLFSSHEKILQITDAPLPGTVGQRPLWGTGPGHKKDDGKNKLVVHGGSYFGWIGPSIQQSARNNVIWYPVKSKAKLYPVDGFKYRE